MKWRFLETLAQARDEHEDEEENRRSNDRLLHIALEPGAAGAEVRERAGLPRRSAAKPGARPYRDWKSPLDAASLQSRGQRILQGSASLPPAFSARHRAPGPLLGRDPLPRVRDIR
jgi:hypothetical protein